MIPAIGNVDITIVYEILTEPAIMILLALCMVAGLLRGKMESDQAKLGVAEYKGMENLTIYDWGEDAGLGLVGGCIGLAILFMTPIFPIFILPSFGYAGRALLMAWGNKAESAIPRPE